MTQHPALLAPRAVELLCDRALDGLDISEHAELAQLFAMGGRQDDQTFDLAAAAVDLSHGLATREALPPALEERITAQALAMLAQPASSVRRASPPGAATLPMDQLAPVVPLAPPSTQRARARSSVLPWLAAAACLALAIGAVAWSIGRPRPLALAPLPPAPEVEMPAPTLAQERDELIAAGAKPTSWSATTDTAAVGASGDVVWDNDKQRGFMRFRGLAKNDPKQVQYQLWIFDKERDDRYPIDGGVFDIDEKSGDVIVAIRAKLPVREPTLFAVTVEKPGGVVVSSRERIVVTAKIPG
jgi:hypothetical protein